MEDQEGEEDKKKKKKKKKREEVWRISLVSHKRQQKRGCPWLSLYIYFNIFVFFFFFFALKFAPCLGMKLGVVFCIVHSEL